MVDEYQDDLDRDKRIQEQLSDYDDELEQLANEIAKTRDLQQAVGEKLSKLEDRYADLQVQRRKRGVELDQAMDAYPDVRRIRIL